MGEGQRSRLKARLRALGPAELVGRARDRAEVTRYVAHSSTGERVYAVDVAGRLGLAATNAIDGYLDTSAVDDVVSR